MLLAHYGLPNNACKVDLTVKGRRHQRADFQKAYMRKTLFFLAV